MLIAAAEILEVDLGLLRTALDLDEDLDEILPAVSPMAAALRVVVLLIVAAFEVLLLGAGLLVCIGLFGVCGSSAFDDVLLHTDLFRRLRLLDVSAATS